MSMSQRLLIPGFVSVFALVSCTENPYDTPYDPYGSAHAQRPLYQNPPPGTTGYGRPQPTTPPYGTPRDPQNPYGTQNPDPYGTAPPPPTVTPPVTPPTGIPGSYPVAERTKNPGFVVSPYDPNRVIDVSEFRSGQLARDPENKKIFRVP